MQEVGSKKKQVVILSVSLVFIVLLLSLGYGFINGQRIKKYAVNSEKVYAETKKWEVDSSDYEDADALKNKIEQARAYSKIALNDLDKPAPKAATILKADLRSYFAATLESTEKMLELVSWMAEIEKNTKTAAKEVEIDSTSPEAMAQSLEARKALIDASILKIDKMVVPETLKDTHAETKKMMVELSEVYGRTVIAIKGNDIAAISAVGTDLAALSRFEPEKYQKQIESFYASEYKKLDNLNLLVESEISRLKKINFSF